ncbi:hypothetical protein LNV47_01605 [Paucibacter sp. DJ4R-1]|nr:hypothetical protein [Paucibacter sp. DJ4R-1]
MSSTALSKIWSFFALPTLTLSFLFFLLTTGAQPKSDAFGLVGYKAVTIPVLALPLDMVMFGILHWVTWVWSETAPSGTWADRFPVFHFERKDVDPTTRGGKVYERWAFTLALVAPLLLTLQMATRFFGGTVYQEGQAAKFATGWGQFGFAKLSAVPGMLRFGDPEGPQFFAWKPWLFAALLVALLVGWPWVMRSVFR